MVLPRSGVSVALFRKDTVLLVKRGKEPFKGTWSLPGGSHEPGETILEAAVREVFEETGLCPVPTELKLVEIFEPIRRDGNGMVTAHFVLAVHAGFSPDGEPVAGDDALEARFHALDGISDLETTPNCEAIIARCRDALKVPL
ncbi:MAG: NUDIX hydrolase [Nitratireductor sp.]